MLSAVRGFLREALFSTRYFNALGSRAGGYSLHHFFLLVFNSLLPVFSKFCAVRRSWLCYSANSKSVDLESGCGSMLRLNTSFSWENIVTISCTIGNLFVQLPRVGTLQWMKAEFDRSIDDEGESKVGIVEPRILSGQILEADQGTWCFLNIPITQREGVEKQWPLLRSQDQTGFRAPWSYLG
jgi:hypothetical protein